MPSSVIRNFRYREEARELHVEFVSGRRYLYLDVPADAVEGLRQANSLGRTFNHSIRDHYAYRELERADRE